MSLATFLVIALVVAAAPADDPNGDPGPRLYHPKLAALEFAEGLDVGDYDRAKAAMIDAEEARHLLRLMTDMVGDHRVLAEAGRSKFGEEGKTLGGAWADPGLAHAVHHGTLEIKGDKAAIKTDDGRILFALKRIKDEWRVDLVASMEPDTRRAGHAFARSSKAAIDTAADILKGKITTLAAAKAALKERGDVPQTQPTTRPTGGSPRSVAQPVTGRRAGFV